MTAKSQDKNEWINFNRENSWVKDLYFDRKITAFANRVGVQLKAFIYGHSFIL